MRQFCLCVGSFCCCSFDWAVSLRNVGRDAQIPRCAEWLGALVQPSNRFLATAQAVISAYVVFVMMRSRARIRFSKNCLISKVRSRQMGWPSPRCPPVHQRKCISSTMTTPGATKAQMCIPDEVDFIRSLCASAGLGGSGVGRTTDRDQLSIDTRVTYGGT